MKDARELPDTSTTAERAATTEGRNTPPRRPATTSVPGEPAREPAKAPPGKHVRRRLLAAFATALLLGAPTAALADYSLRLGAVFPGWTELRRTGADGQVHESMTDLARRYALRLGRFCSLPEVFLRDSSSSILTALVFYEGFLPYGSSERVLLDSVEQRVSIVTSSYGSETLVVLARLDRLGVAMAACAI